MTFWSMKKVKYLKHYDVPTCGYVSKVMKIRRSTFCVSYPTFVFNFFYDFDISVIRQKSLMEEYMILDRYITLDKNLTSY